MKKIPLILLAAVLSISSCDSNQPAEVSETTSVTADSTAVNTEADTEQEGDYLIKPGQVGRITIGMRSDDVRPVYPQQRLQKAQLQKEGMNYDAWLIKDLAQADEVLFEAEMQCVPGCRVWRIHVKSNKLKTAEGIGVGSSFNQLKNAYKIDYYAAGEGNIVAVSEEKNMSFLLDDSNIDQSKLPRLRGSDIPDDTQVVGVLVL